MGISYDLPFTIGDYNGFCDIYDVQKRMRKNECMFTDLKKEYGENMYSQIAETQFPCVVV